MSKGALEDIERLRRWRYDTKGPGASRARAPAKPDVQQLRAKVAKVAKRRPKKR